MITISNNLEKPTNKENEIQKLSDDNLEEIGVGLSKTSKTFLKVATKPLVWAKDKIYGLDDLSEEEKSKRLKAAIIARGKMGLFGLGPIFRSDYETKNK